MGEENIMKSMCIHQQRINKLSILQEFDLKKIQIGIPVKGDEAERIGLKEVGDTVLPDAKFGSQSRKNAYGYTYPDKTKEKEKRYVSTNWIHPYGNENASEIAVDISRKCYPKVEVAPYGIELCLYENGGNRFVIVDMNDDIREKHMLDAINLMLEIYGFCYLYDNVIQIEEITSIRRCNWEILPPGEMPSKHVERCIEDSEKNKDTYDIYRLKQIERYKAKEIVEGINGFRGYYAYIFDEYCVLESAWYGNATFIIPYNNWETLSQKTKQELFDENVVTKRIVHKKNWKNEIKNTFSELGIELVV